MIVTQNAYRKLHQDVRLRTSDRDTKTYTETKCATQSRKQGEYKYACSSGTS